MCDVATGLKPIPNEIGGLKEIASPIQPQQEDADIDYTGKYISYFLRISESNSRSSLEPGLKPFVERGDILKELRTLGFDDKDIDINTSVSPVHSI